MRLVSGTTRHSLIIDLMSKSSWFVRAALKQILDVGRAEDVVEVFLVDGVARVAPVYGGVDNLGERGVARDGLYIGPRDHDLAGHPVAEVEDLVQVVALLGVEHARGCRGGDHDP